MEFFTICFVKLPKTGRLILCILPLTLILPFDIMITEKCIRILGKGGTYMKKSMRLLSLLLMLLMIATTFAGCADSGNKEQDGEPDKEENSTDSLPSDDNQIGRAHV